MTRRARLLLNLSLRNVFRNRRRSLYALATIGMGAMGLFIFMGFNRGLMEQYRANTIRARWGYGQVTVQGYRTKAHARPWEQWIPGPERVLADLRAIPGVTDLFPRVPLQALLVSGRHVVAGQGEGVDGAREAVFFNQLNYVQGGDFAGREDGIVLGAGLAEGLGLRVGDRVRLEVRSIAGAPASATVKVYGVFHTGSQEFDSRAFRVPLKIAQRLLGTERVECISVALTGLAAWEGFAREAQRRLPALEAVAFNELDKVYYQHAVDWLDAQFGFIRGIILLVVFLAIFNVISMTVMERTAEIGTLRANGDGRGEIALGHVTEAALLGLLGAGSGLLAGWLLAIGPLHAGVAMPPAPGITRSFRILIELSWHDAFQVCVLCAVTSVVGCLLPVWRATRIPIPEALRHA